MEHTTTESEKQGISCREIEELSDDYIDGQLSALKREVVDDHLHSCENCTQLISDLELVVRSAKELAQKPIPPSVHARLRDALKKQIGIEIGAELERPLYLVKGSDSE